MIQNTDILFPINVLRFFSQVYVYTWTQCGTRNLSKKGGGLRRKITPPDPGELKFTTTVIAKIKEYTTLFEQPRLPSPYVRHK